MRLKSVNPATNEIVERYDAHSLAQVDQILHDVEHTFKSWRKKSFAERASLMKAAGQNLRQNARRYGQLMAEEMGKPIKDGISEAEKCAWVCDYYAEHAAQFLKPEVVATDASESFITFQPLGVVLAVMPWNFPFWQVFRFAAPSLMAGNTAVLKHAANVSGCALAIEQIFRDSGFPENAFRSLLIGSDKVARVIENPLVKAVTLTGSTKAGRAVAQKAGEMLKKTVLELGGSDPYLILEDADLESAVETCVSSRLINSGQSCIAAKRFVVVESQLDSFIEKFVARMKEAKMGDPLNDKTDIGPQARHDLRDELHQQVQKSIEKGAICMLGGEVPDGDGAYYPPTVLTQVKPGMPAFDEELFGPVAAIISVPNEEEAIRVANNSSFGLGAAVFTQDIERGKKIAAEQLEAGACFVNALVKSDPRLPFGGIKESGYGRELSQYGIKEFVNVKSVYIQ